MKKKINQKKYKRKICFDLDGVICRTEKNFYQKSKPIINSIKKINQLYDNRNYILIYSARFMGRSKENSNDAKRRGYSTAKKGSKRTRNIFEKLRTNGRGKNRRTQRSQSDVKCHYG